MSSLGSQSFTDNLKTTTITDILNLTGVPGSVLSSTPTGIQWSPLPIIPGTPDLQSVCNVGNTTTTDITASSFTLPSITPASLDYFYSQVSGATTTADYSITYFDGILKVPLILNGNGRLTLTGSSAGLQLQDQSTAFAYTIFSTGNILTITFNQTPTTPFMLNSLGQLILNGTQARLRLNSTTVGSADYFYSQVSGASGTANYSITYFDGILLTTNVPVVLNGNGKLTLTGSTAGLQLEDQTSAFAYLIESIANQFTITFNQTPTTPLVLNSFGQLILNGTQARLRLNSTTVGSADYYYSQVSGATTLATYNLFYFNGTTTINPLRLNTNGTLDLGTVAGSATGINLFGVGTSFLDCADASKGKLEFFMSGDVRLTAGGVTPALLNISTLGVLSFTGASATLTLTGTGATGGTINLVGVGTSSINCTDANKGQLDFLISNEVVITAGGGTPADLELTNLGILTLSRAGTGNCSLQFGGLGTNTILCNNTAKGAISFAMTGTVTITAGGASPGTMSLTNAGLLTVSGQVVCDAYRVTAASTAIGISLVSVNLVAQNSNSAFGSGNFCYVAPSGNTWIAVSDKRIKHDIVPLENCLEKILLLNPVNYKMNYDDKQCVGFIAQEVLEVIPELVVVPENADQLMGVDLTNMIVFLVKAVQEQNKLIQFLYNKLELK